MWMTETKRNIVMASSWGHSTVTLMVMLSMRHWHITDAIQVSLSVSCGGPLVTGSAQPVTPDKLATDLMDWLLLVVFGGALVPENKNNHLVVSDRQSLYVQRTIPAEIYSFPFISVSSSSLLSVNILGSCVRSRFEISHTASPELLSPVFRAISPTGQQGDELVGAENIELF